MVYDPQKHNRRSIRLKSYDYSSPGEYFVTLCTQNRECLFGEVVNGEMELNTAGRMLDDWWNKIPDKFFNVRLDVYQIMPNHFHAIVGIIDPELMETNPNEANNHNRGKETGDNQLRGGHTGPPQPDSSQPGSSNVGADPRICPDNDNPSQPDFNPRLASIPDIVQWFKTMTTNKYIQGVKEGRFPPFDRKLWQRNYYEHIIRDEQSLERIRNYIINNPAKWERDRNNPKNY